ncbi:MAG: hypothetical protein K0S14_879 [Thermomicrobiales bacterium]|jgi:hypothetical protein|nr:hypothetical protein [Thermomicrobiales bacterium]
MARRRAQVSHRREASRGLSILDSRTGAVSCMAPVDDEPRRAEIPLASEENDHDDDHHWAV